MSKGFLRKEKEWPIRLIMCVYMPHRKGGGQIMRIISGVAEVPAGAQPGVDGILAGHTQHWQLPMLAVFDGTGGESYGEMAASAAVEALGGLL